MTLDKSNYNILVIEDNPGDFLLVEDYLQEHILRPNTKQAKRFKEARELLADESAAYEIILLDLSLPDINKEDMIQEVYKITPHIPVIILTGFSDLDFATKSLSLGISDYLVKDTINSLVLYKSIVYALERHQFVTTLRASEKRYMDLFHLSPASMWVFDHENLRFLDVNDAAIQHYGYSRDEFLNMTLYDIRPKEDYPLLEEALIMAREGNPIKLYRTFQHKKKDGSIIYAEVVSNGIEYENIKAEIVMSTDITEKLQHMNAIATQNEKLKEIAWTQSHLVRAPVARMMGLIDLLKSGDINPVEHEQILTYIYTSAEEIDSVIKNVVDQTQSAVEVK